MVQQKRELGGLPVSWRLSGPDGAAGSPLMKTANKETREEEEEKKEEYGTP